MKYMLALGLLLFAATLFAAEAKFELPKAPENPIEAELEEIKALPKMEDSGRTDRHWHNVCKVTKELVKRDYILEEDADLVNAITKERHKLNNPKYIFKEKTLRVSGVRDYRFKCTDTDGVIVQLWFDCPADIKWGELNIWLKSPKRWRFSMNDHWQCVNIEGYTLNLTYLWKRSIRGDPTINWREKIDRDDKEDPYPEIWPLRGSRITMVANPDVAKIRNFKKGQTYLFELYFHPVSGEVSKKEFMEIAPDMGSYVNWYEDKPKEAKKDDKPDSAD